MKNEKSKNPTATHTTLKGMAHNEHDKIQSRLTHHYVEIEAGPLSGGKVPKNPFASQAQAGFMHTHPDILGEAGLKEWDKASKGKKLPKHVK